MRLVGYPGVSARGQVKTGASIPFQDREIRAWARRNGRRIVGMFPEEGRSGALDLEDRVALTAAIDMIATGKAGGRSPAASVGCNRGGLSIRRIANQLNSEGVPATIPDKATSAIPGGSPAPLDTA